MNSRARDRRPTFREWQRIHQRRGAGPANRATYERAFGIGGGSRAVHALLTKLRRLNHSLERALWKARRR